MSYEKTVRVVLHGYLKDLYKDEIVLSGHSAAEVLNGMCKMTSAFNPEPLKDRHLVAISGFTTKEEIYGPLPADIKELHISPAMTGGKKGGFFQIVIGVIAIAAAVWTGGAELKGENCSLRLSDSEAKLIVGSSFLKLSNDKLETNRPIHAPNVVTTTADFNDHKHPVGTTTSGTPTL